MVWASCETTPKFIFARSGIGQLSTNAVHRRATGTPLEWPEAKKVADHVRNWGIEVSASIRFMSVKLRNHVVSKILGLERHWAESKLIGEVATPFDMATSERQRTRCTAVGR